ncbi:uncharacterized protein LOC112879965 [Panicum hallii]|jgi:hypothetical protein|uniref:uncharacterized protein LOC112879965 n=1 Tax=Panicum hallii TaxID=206008 RepID=UPI000DF4E772|nr:uncharacterized protein LOC112879965 [Panicum hallii]
MGAVLSVVMGQAISRMVSMVLGRYRARASAGDQLEHLGLLAIMLHSTVEEAERVHIRSRWLRRWLWRLRDAALDGDEVLQSLRQQRIAGEAAATGNRLWNAGKRVFRSAKSLLFTGDNSMERLSGAVTRLERTSMGIAGFLKLLMSETRRSMRRTQQPLPAGADDSDDDDDDGSNDDAPDRKTNIRLRTTLDGSESELQHDAAHQIGSMIRIGLMMVMQNVWQVIAGSGRHPPTGLF